MGGCIAQVYAARHPDRVSALVLADTWTPPHRSRSETFQYEVLLPGIVPLVRLVGYERVEKAMVWVRERFSKGVSGEYENIERLREGAPKMTTDEFAKVMGALATFRDVDVDHAAIAAPTLVLYGENAPLFTRRHVPALEASLPNATVGVVPGAGHASNLDDPAFFSDAVRSFLATSGVAARPEGR